MHDYMESKEINQECILIESQERQIKIKLLSQDKKNLKIDSVLQQSLEKILKKQQETKLKYKTIKFLVVLAVEIWAENEPSARSACNQESFFKMSALVFAVIFKLMWQWMYSLIVCMCIQKENLINLNDLAGCIGWCFCINKISF